jgi:UDP-N-acetylglucosamine 2-epimerase (non-hydrolysing)/GDP/UDP-N,N'-diacetylbacillosamine 2-epimerase (hydrolysing)
MRLNGLFMSETSTKRRIGVVTTSRADYSHLYWPLRELAANPAVELGVFALGAHLSPEFGSTIQEIERDGFPIKARIECLLSSDTETGMAKTIGIAILGLADALANWRPDLLLLIADRYEMLAPASVATALRIPIAHIEGGEISQGAIDDQVRNALTKLAHIHFTSTETARRRVIAMGEEPWRVTHAGAPSLDHLRRSKLLDRAALEARLGIPFTPPTILVADHPVTILRDTTAEADALFGALAAAPGQLLFVYPNSDAGSYALIERTRALAATRPGTHIFVNLDAVTYWSLLGQVDAIVGNSSSGIMESASFALPTVNVGLRQQGRERARNILDAPAETAAILAAITQALDPGFRESLRGMANPYGNGTAAETISRVLSTIPLDGLLIKQPMPLPEIAEPESAERIATSKGTDFSHLKGSCFNHLKGTGFSPYINPTEKTGVLQVAEKLVVLKGHDFSRAVSTAKSTGALAPEGCFCGNPSENRISSSKPQIPLSSPDITQAEIDAVTAVLHTPHLSLGPELSAFEAALANFHSVPDAVAVSSGTAGLHLALLTLGIGEGDEVIVPSFTFVAVANAVLQVRATPVFAEIDPVTLNLDPAAVEQAITPRTRALLVVHTFGVPAQMDKLQAIARRHHLTLIEDACEAIGAEFQGQRTGSFGDLAVFGFYPNKQITTGEGGAVLVRDPAHAIRLRSLRNQGRRGPQRQVFVAGVESRLASGDWLDHAEVGYNYRLSELACALGRVQLSRISPILALRQAAAERYDALLKEIPGLELPPLTLPQRAISWFVYVVRLPERVDRNRVQAALASCGIATGRYFAPIHLQPAWRAQLCARAAMLPVTEAIARRTLALPFFNRISSSQQEEVAVALREAIGFERERQANSKQSTTVTV